MISKCVFALLGCCLSVAVGGAASVRAADIPAEANPSPQEMLQELRALRAEVKDLRGKLESQSPATQPATEIHTPDVASPNASASLESSKRDLVRDADHRSIFADVQGFTAGYDPAKGFVIQSEDGSFMLHPWAWVQVRDTLNYRQGGRAGGGDDTQNVAAASVSGRRSCSVPVSTATHSAPKP